MSEQLGTEIGKLIVKCQKQAAEIERLRESLDCESDILKQVQQERDQLKAELFKHECTDVDVIRCLKTLAYEHNHGDMPRYQSLAKRAMGKYVERCAAAKGSLAAHDAEVIERAADLFCGLGTLYESKIKAILCEHGDQLRASANEQHQ